MIFELGTSTASTSPAKLYLHLWPQDYVVFIIVSHRTEINEILLTSQNKPVLCVRNTMPINKLMRDLKYNHVLIQTH